jgi:hypothetical protein
LLYKLIYFSSHKGIVIKNIPYKRWSESISHIHTSSQFTIFIFIVVLFVDRWVSNRRVGGWRVQSNQVDSLGMFDQHSHRRCSLVGFVAIQRRECWMFAHLSRIFQVYSFLFVSLSLKPNLLLFFIVSFLERIAAIKT